MKKILMPFLMLIMSFSLFGCKTTDVDIYTSVYPLQFITEQIVGDKLTVSSMYPQSAEVHDYEPSAKSLIDMSEAKIIVYIGQGLEPFIEKGLNTTFKNVLCVKITGYDKIELVNSTGVHTHSDDDEVESAHDAHVWLDVAQMTTITDYILSNILSIDEYSQYAEEFTANANELKNKFDALALKYETEIKKTAMNTIIVDHDAYAYWSFRYNITRKSLRSDNGTSDPTSKAFIDTINIAVENKLNYLLATTNESQQSLVNQYINSIKSKDDTIDAQVLYLNNLERSPENKDYFEVMEDNLLTLIKALNNN